MRPPAGAADFGEGRVGVVVGLRPAFLYTVKRTAAVTIGVSNASDKMTPAMAFRAQFIVVHEFGIAPMKHCRGSAKRRWIIVRYFDAIMPSTFVSR